MKKCILNLRSVCNDCGECDTRCSRDINKVCDNCFKCLDEDQPDFMAIEIDGVVDDPEEAEEYDY